MEVLAPARVTFATGRPYTQDDIDNYTGTGERPVLGLSQGYSTQTTPTPVGGSGSGTGPQVLVYDDLGNDPALSWINGFTRNLYGDQWGSLGSYDPASKTALNAPRTLNAASVLQALDNPVMLNRLRAAYKLHGRDWDTEAQAALGSGPRGNATAYTRTG